MLSHCENIIPLRSAPNLAGLCLLKPPFNYSPTEVELLSANIVWILKINSQTRQKMQSQFEKNHLLWPTNALIRLLHSYIHFEVDNLPAHIPSDPETTPNIYTHNRDTTEFPTTTLPPSQPEDWDSYSNKNENGNKTQIKCNKVGGDPTTTNRWTTSTTYAT